MLLDPFAGESVALGAFVRIVSTVASVVVRGDGT